MIWALLLSQLHHPPLSGTPKASGTLASLGLQTALLFWLVLNALGGFGFAFEQSLFSVQGQLLVYLLLTASHLSGLIPDTHTSLPKRAPQEEGLIA